MATPRNAFVVHMVDGSGPHLVMSEQDAKTFPGRLRADAVVVIRGDAPDLFYRLSHGSADAPPMVFDQVAADARKALRVSARQKLTPEEREACGIAVAE